MNKTWLKFVLWTTIANGIIHSINQPGSIKLAFSSVGEFICATFGLIMMGVIFGSIIFGIWRAFTKKKGEGVFEVDRTQSNNISMPNIKIKIKQIFWPTISDTKSAKWAAALGVWALIIGTVVEGISIAIQGASFVDYLWGIPVVVIISVAIFKMLRTGAVLGLILVGVSLVIYWHERRIATSPLFVLFLINSVRGTFAYHRFVLQEIKDNPSLIKPKLKHSKLGKYSVLIFTGVVFIIIAGIVLNELKPELRVTKILGMVAALGGIIGSLIGSILGVIGIFQKNRKMLLPILGLILNTGMLAIFFYYIAIGFSQKP